MLDVQVPSGGKGEGEPTRDCVAEISHSEAIPSVQPQGQFFSKKLRYERISDQDSLSSWICKKRIAKPNRDPHVPCFCCEPLGDDQELAVTHFALAVAVWLGLGFQHCANFKKMGCSNGKAEAVTVGSSR